MKNDINTVGIDAKLILAYFHPFSTSTINNRANAQVGQVPLSKTNESEIPSSIMAAASLGMTGLDQNSPRVSNLYQESPYTTPTKQDPTENTKVNHWELTLRTTHKLTSHYKSRVACNTIISSSF